MIRVPDLKPGESPFDPAFEHSMEPWKIGVQSDPDSASEQSPEQRMEALLNLAVVKEITTCLHRDEDAYVRELEGYASFRICDIAGDHEKFLHVKMADAENRCKNGEQKNLLHAMTRAFLAQSRERAKALQYRKTAEYYRETVEAQNSEFLVRALRAENIADDDALALYRKLIFYNMENMLSDFPEKERKEKLAAAAAAFYGKVLEKRLESDPAGVLAMVEKSEVKTALGEGECGVFASRAKQALRMRELAGVAENWAAEGKSPEEAKQFAGARYSDEVERAHVLACYDSIRFEQNTDRLAKTVAVLENAWNMLKEKNFEESFVRDLIDGINPALAECLREALRLRGDAGGGEGATDYAGVMGFFTRFARDGVREAMEHLREEKDVYALLLAAGGPDTKHWLLCLRLLGGAAGGGDREYVAALRAAWGDGRPQEFMECFAAELKLLEEKGLPGSPLAVRDVVRRLSESVLL